MYPQADHTSNITRPPTVVIEADAAFTALEEGAAKTMMHGGDEECVMNAFVEEEFESTVMEHTSYNKQILKEKRAGTGDDGKGPKKARTGKKPESKTQEITRLLKTSSGASKKLMVAYIDEVGSVNKFKSDGCTVVDAKELTQRLRLHFGMIEGGDGK